MSWYWGKRVGRRNRSFVRIRFRRCTSAQLSRAVKADEISIVEPTQPLRLARQSKNNKEARTFVPASLFLPKYRTDHLIIETVLGQETILKTTDSFQKRDQISLK